MGLLKSQLENLVEELSIQFCLINRVTLLPYIYDQALKTILHGAAKGSSWDKKWVSDFIENFKDI